MPNVESLIEVINPEDNSTWLNLNSNFEWREDAEKQVEESSLNKIRLWYDFGSFFVKKKDFSDILNWSKSNRFPHNISIEREYHIKLFLGEFYWSPAYKYSNTPFIKDDDWINYNDKIPNKVLPSTLEYSHAGGEYDCSVTNDDAYDFRILLPTKYLVDKMNLNWNGKEGYFFDKHGKLTVFDPSIRQKGNHALLIRKDSLLDFLNKYELNIIWVLYGEKMSYDERVFRKVRPLDIRGIYYIENNVITGSFNTSFEKD